MIPPFDIVWYSAGNAEEAMRSLIVLPRRVKSHPFVMASNAPMPDSTGKRVGKGYCVYADYLGSELLRPGEEADGRVLITDNCREIVEVKEGFVGAWFKEGLFASGAFLASAQAREKEEKATAERIAKIREETVTQYDQTRTNAVFAYFRTCALMTLRSGFFPSPQPSFEDLQEIVKMGMIMGIEFPDMDMYLAMVLKDIPKPIGDVNEGEYDPVSFLAHTSQMFEIAKGR